MTGASTPTMWAASVGKVGAPDPRRSMSESGPGLNVLKLRVLGFGFRLGDFRDLWGLCLRECGELVYIQGCCG